MQIDPTVVAYELLRRADEALEYILARQAPEPFLRKALRSLEAASRTFANSVPTTNAGVVLKQEALAQPFRQDNRGDELTPTGWANLHRHANTLQEGLGRMRATIG